jgi:predicted transport protein
MATSTLQQQEANQIKNLEEQSGKSFAEWIKIVQDSKLEKHGELVNMLKEKYKIGHGYANLVVHHAKQSHAGAAGEENDLIAEQYKGKENLRSWYDTIIKKVSSFGNDIEIAPKKAYVSLRRKKQFLIIQPSTKSRMDIGLNLKNVSPSGKLEAAGSWNSMCTHRVKLEDEKAIDDNLFKWVKEGYDQAG